MEPIFLKAALGFVALVYTTTIYTFFGPNGLFHGRAPAFAATTERQSTVSSSQDFAWDEVPSLEHLKWQDCYDDFQCARLSVPLNHAEPSGRKASIALIRKPANVSSSSPEYRGPILFNPGGPGGSGVDLVLQLGKKYAELVGLEFDVVGFDPRGIARSTPRASFFKTHVERELWLANMYRYLGSDEDVATTYARAQVLNGQAAETDDGYLRYINTEQTARDMLSIVHAHGRDKLQYWGFSYGTVLGVTFASLFPDKVERLVIDGVVDAENYYSGLWSHNLFDIGKTMQSFYTECAGAGLDGCPFWAPTADDVERNLTKLYKKVLAQPVPVKLSDGRFGIVNHAFLKGVVFKTLYSPFAKFPPLAQALADLAEGDGRAVYDLESAAPFHCDCCGKDSQQFTPVNDAAIAIRCTDADQVVGDLTEVLQYHRNLLNQSEFGPLWSGLRIGCIGWPAFPRDTFRGPFAGNTSHPLLVIGNTADPVTPLWAAKKMVKGFSGAVLLTQDSPGHCSDSMPSTCTASHIRQYFKIGVLPPLDTVCSVDKGPFPNKNGQSGTSTRQKMFVTDEEARLAEVVEEISRIGIPRMLH